MGAIIHNLHRSRQSCDLLECRIKRQLVQAIGGDPEHERILHTERNKVPDTIMRYDTTDWVEKRDIFREDAMFGDSEVTSSRTEVT